MNKKYNILIVYIMYKYPVRATLWDQLYCFRNYTDHRCYYVNLAVRSVPWYIKQVKFDLIVFGTLILANRIVDEWFEPLVKGVLPLKELETTKIALPQDEYTHTNVLTDFIKEFDIKHVYSVSPESEWPKIYAGLDAERVKFKSVLTGYLDDQTLARIEKLSATKKERTIDIGYRTFRAPLSLGRHGFLRTQLGELFQEKAPPEGLVTDISMRVEDTLWGDAWYEFLLRCKYTISVEGGASILDRDGAIKQCSEDYVEHHPEASFEEVERVCFPGRDGELQLKALSPRHLEACATRTCQILVEGNYNGVLKAGEHYIELKSDFSNLDEVLRVVKSDDQREAIAARAYRDVVASGQYTYRSFAQFIINSALENAPPREATQGATVWTPLIYYWMKLSDFLGWVQVALYLFDMAPRIRGQARLLLTKIFSEEAVASAKGRVKQMRGKQGNS
jgi:hypothetical protein